MTIPRRTILPISRNASGVTCARSSNSPYSPVYWNQRLGGESRQVFEFKRVTRKVFIS
jgi:hypothetical protein